MDRLHGRGHERDRVHRPPCKDRGACAWPSEECDTAASDPWPTSSSPSAANKSISIYFKNILETFLIYWTELTALHSGLELKIEIDLTIRNFSHSLANMRLANTRTC